MNLRMRLLSESDDGAVYKSRGATRAVAADGRPRRGGRVEHADAVARAICDVDIVISVHRHLHRTRELADAYGAICITSRSGAADGRPQRGGRGEHADVEGAEVCDVEVAVRAHRHAERNIEPSGACDAFNMTSRAIAADGRSRRGGRGELADPVV